MSIDEKEIKADGEVPGVIEEEMTLDGFEEEVKEEPSPEALGKDIETDGFPTDVEDASLPEIDFNFEEPEEEEEEEDPEKALLSDLSMSLGQQVSDELGAADETGEGSEEEGRMGRNKGNKKKRLALRIVGGIVLAIVIFLCWLLLTESGRRFGIRLGVSYFYGDIGNVITEIPTVTVKPGEEPDSTPVPTEGEAQPVVSEHRTEEYVKNYFIFGLQESNSDAMMIISINTKDSTVKLTSLLRDTYVTIPGHRRNKINSVYAYGGGGAEGAKLLVDVVEDTYDIEIEGYAYVDYSAFEGIVDILGGVDLELGETEAAYLRRTNYISNPSYRTVVAGWNYGLNGNQVLGYCRVRKVSTLGGATNDYGRTLRQRRVIKAIFERYKSYGILDMVSLTSKCLQYLSTNLTADQITDALSDIVEHSVYSIDSARLPMDELFYDSGKKGIDGITYALVIDDHIDENIKRLHQFIFLDPTDTPVPTAADADGTGTAVTP